MTASNWDVAVVGAGVTGVALTIQLAPRLAPGSRILVIGSPGETGLVSPTAPPLRIISSTCAPRG